MSSLYKKVLFSGRRACLVAVGAAVLAVSCPVTTSASADTPVPGSGERHNAFMPSGIAYLPARVDLQPTAPGTWVDTDLQVTLPKSGTYALDLNVRTRLTGAAPVNVFITGRLWNTTSGVVFPNSERILNQVYDATATGSGGLGANVTSPISELVTVTGRTTIRLEVQRNVLLGASTTADVWTDANGRTSFRYHRIF